MVYKRSGHWHLDVTISGVRYREALKTTDWREALRLEKKRVSEVQAGKGATKSGRDFARLAFGDAADRFCEEREPHVSKRTAQLDRERLKPLREFFGDRPLLRVQATEIATYQKARRSGGLRMKGGDQAKSRNGVSNRTVNMEIAVLRQMMRRAKTWLVVAEDVRMLPEQRSIVGRVLTSEQKALLFGVAGTKESWVVAHCAAVLAVSTTCRGVELKHLRWADLDLMGGRMTVRRSKTEAGQRTIPLNSDATTALARLLKRSETHSASKPEHFVFPACENEKVDPTHPQKTWRTAWRSLLKAAANKAGREAAKAAVEGGADPDSAHRAAAAVFDGLRFHDLRHQAITELAEHGASDATVMALAGHMSREMMEHYSHVRMAAKREAVDGLSTGLIKQPSTDSELATDAIH